MIKRPPNAGKVTAVQHFSEDSFYQYENDDSDKENRDILHLPPIHAGGRKAPASRGTRIVDLTLAPITVSRSVSPSSRPIVLRDNGAGRTSEVLTLKSATALSTQCPPSTPPRQQDDMRLLDKQLRSSRIQRIPRSNLLDILAAAKARRMNPRCGAGNSQASTFGSGGMTAPPLCDTPGFRAQSAPEIPLDRLARELMDSTKKEFFDAGAEALQNSTALKFDGLRVLKDERTTPKPGWMTQEATHYKDALLRNLRSLIDLSIPETMKMPETTSATPKQKGQTHSARITPQRRPRSAQSPAKVPQTTRESVRTPRPENTAPAYQQESTSQTMGCSFPEASESSSQLLENIKRRRLVPNDVIPHGLGYEYAVADGVNGFTTTTGISSTADALPYRSAWSEGPADVFMGTSQTRAKDNSSRLAAAAYNIHDAFDSNPTDMLMEEDWNVADGAMGYDGEGMVWSEMPRDDAYGHHDQLRGGQGNTTRTYDRLDGRILTTDDLIFGGPITCSPRPAPVRWPPLYPFDYESSNENLRKMPPHRMF
eukprot:Opistho-2@34357